MPPLRLPQFGDEVLDLAGAFVRGYPALPPPAVHVAAPEHGVGLALADRLWVVALLLELAHHLGSYVADECGVGHGLVWEIDGKHGGMVKGL